jgi:hypothetical protein
MEYIKVPVLLKLFELNPKRLHEVADKQSHPALFALECLEKVKPSWNQGPSASRCLDHLCEAFWVS